jgi:hypothetical protein
LTPAPGRQDHTTSPYATASFAARLSARPTLPRPPHPAPNVRDDGETPLSLGHETADSKTDFAAGVKLISDNQK